ncbi:MAG: hypothetical protein ABIP90_02385 [Vicinamibacterales bacterium]
MNRQVKIFAGVIAMAVAVGSVMSAQAPVTITLRSGEVRTATLVDMGMRGFEITVNGAQQWIPKDQVAIVDFGGNVTPQPAWFNGMTSNLVVFKNGDTLKTELTDVGGTSPLILRVNNGQGERELSSNDVARIYLVAPSGMASTTTAMGGAQGDGAVNVNAADPWTSTGITVRTGDMLRFSVSRDIRFGPGANDVATADGNASGDVGGTLFRRLPVTSLPVGGLIGKVGNGRAFSIGSAPQAIRMPANGQLFLGINDLTFNDNSGWFRVVVTR